MLPPLKPIPIKDRVSVVFVEKGHLDVLDGAFVVVDVFPTDVGMDQPLPTVDKDKSAHASSSAGLPHSRTRADSAAIIVPAAVS